MKEPLDILMIGDLVLNHNNKICKVTGLTEDKITVKEQDLSITYDKAGLYVHPILLTTEIIENLGWEKLEETNKNYNKSLGYGEQYKHPWYTTLLTIRKNSNDYFWILNNAVNMKYLHDLQHVLLQTVNDTVIYEENKLCLFARNLEHKYTKL